MVWLPLSIRKCTPCSSGRGEVSRNATKGLLAAGKMSGACVSSTVLVSTSGHQNTGLSPAFSDGGTKKLQTPLSVE
jgi:hypothetical protein